MLLMIQACVVVHMSAYMRNSWSHVVFAFVYFVKLILWYFQIFGLAIYIRCTIVRVLYMSLCISDSLPIHMPVFICMHTVKNKFCELQSFAVQWTLSTANVHCFTLAI